MDPAHFIIERIVRFVFGLKQNNTEWIEAMSGELAHGCQIFRELTLDKIC